MQCRRIKTAGKCAAARRLCQVVSSCKSRDRVKQNHNILLVLDKALGSFNDHLGNPLVMFWRFIKGRVNDFDIRSRDCLFDISYFFGTLINQKDDQVNFRIVELHALGDFLDKRCLAGLRRRNNHASLPLAHRAEQVHNAHRDCRIVRLETDLLVREDRRHVFEIKASFRVFRISSVDGIDKKQCGKLLALRPDPDMALDDIAGLQIETPDLAGRNIDIIIAGQIVCGADESIAVRHNFQNSVCHFSAVEFFIQFILVQHRLVRSHKASSLITVINFLRSTVSALGRRRLFLSFFARLLFGNSIVGVFRRFLRGRGSAAFLRCCTRRAAFRRSPLDTSSLSCRCPGSPLGRSFRGLRRGSCLFGNRFFLFLRYRSGRLAAACCSCSRLFHIELHHLPDQLRLLRARGNLQPALLRDRAKICHCE